MSSKLQMFNLGGTSPPGPSPESAPGSMRLPNRSTLLSTRSTRSTMCRSFCNWSKTRERKIRCSRFSLQLYWKRDFARSVFLWIFAKFLRTPFLTEHLQWLLDENSKVNNIAHTFFDTVTGNRISDHYARNTYIKVFL